MSLLVLSCFLLCVCIPLAVVAVNPIVFFPGYSLSIFQVTVTNGTVAGCPTSGSFFAHFSYDTPQNGFSDECMMKYMALVYDDTQPLGSKFSNLPGVSITIPGWPAGNASACVYQGLYGDFFSYFVNKGYTIGTNTATILGGCYDWRLDPINNAITNTNFLQNTHDIVVKAYTNAGNQKVWLIGHSNGPIMMAYFLNQMTQAFKNQYIAGFIPLSGNFAGQGFFLSVFYEGLTIKDFSFSPATSGVHRTWSSAFFSSPQPAVFSGNQQVTVISTVTPARAYNTTAADYDALFTDSGYTFGLNHWRDYVGIVGPQLPPWVYTHAFWGFGFDTVVGVQIDSFTNITITQLYNLPGDINQEYIDNESIKVWGTTMPSGCFTFEQMNGVNHFELVSNTTVLDRVWAVINAGVPLVNCASSSNTTTTATSTSTSAAATTATATATSTSTTSTTSAAISTISVGVSAIVGVGMLLLAATM